MISSEIIPTQIDQPTFSNAHYEKGSINSLSFSDCIIRSAFNRLVTFSDLAKLANNFSFWEERLTTILTKHVFEDLISWIGELKGKVSDSDDLSLIQQEIVEFLKTDTDINSANIVLKSFETQIMKVIGLDISFFQALNIERVPPFFHRFYTLCRITKLLQEKKLDQAEALILSVRTRSSRNFFIEELGKTFAKNRQYEKALGLASHYFVIAEKIRRFVRCNRFENEHFESLDENTIRDFFSYLSDLIYEIEGDVDLEKLSGFIEMIPEENPLRTSVIDSFLFLKEEVKAFRLSERLITSSNLYEAYKAVLSIAESSFRRDLQLFKIAKILIAENKLLQAMVVLFSQVYQSEDVKFPLSFKKMLNSCSRNERFFLFSNLFYKKDRFWHLNNLESVFHFFIVDERKRLQKEINETSGINVFVDEYKNLVDNYFTDTEIDVGSLDEPAMTNMKERMYDLVEWLIPEKDELLGDDDLI